MNEMIKIKNLKKIIIDCPFQLNFDSQLHILLNLICIFFLRNNFKFIFKFFLLIHILNSIFRKFGLKNVLNLNKTGKNSQFKGFFVN